MRAPIHPFPRPKTIMLNRPLTYVLAAASLALAGTASAETKIGTIRAQEVVRESPYYKAAETKMRGEFDKRQKELEATGKSLSEDIKKFQRDADIMSPDERAKKQKDLQGRQVDFEYAQQKFKEDATNRDRELTQDLMSKIKEAIQAVAKDKGLDLVVQDPVYTVPSLDITDEVLKQLQAAGGSAGSDDKKKGKKD
jgi:outer membrane protein